MTYKERGQLFALQLERSHAARQDALASIRRVGPDAWKVRIGGRMRGAWFTFMTRDAAVACVKKHYDAALMTTISRKRRPEATP